MMVQDKPLNPFQAIHAELTHLLPSPVGERKKWSAGGVTAGTEPDATPRAEPESEATAHAVNKNAAHDGRARSA